MIEVFTILNPDGIIQNIGVDLDSAVPQIVRILFSPIPHFSGTPCIIF